ncbi:hypothetical protein Q31a_35890 [Aureliella helgolandensis]|uniref:Uncharacterized protein n=1 Tax=Aureliella helgolandensis TaxID=2527968 RepID=A0A518G9K0_9BACT|nr:hypothetical protein Q31a_35890 [Aureliella helgolandensis]
MDSNTQLLALREPEKDEPHRLISSIYGGDTQHFFRYQRLLRGELASSDRQPSCPFCGQPPHLLQKTYDGRTIGVIIDDLAANLQIHRWIFTD